MPQYEYSVVPAPRQVPKVKGVKGTELRFAHGMTDLLNAWGAEGWEFLRAETLPCEERSGLIGRSTGSQVVLVFRRELEEPAPRSLAEIAPTPEELAQDLPQVSPRPVDPIRDRPAEPRADSGPRLTASRAAPSAKPVRPLPGLGDGTRKG